jgi:HEAT repeat protein
MWRSLISVVLLSSPLLLIPSGPAASATPLSNAGPVLQDFGKQAQDQSLPEAERIRIISLLGLWGTDDVVAPLLAVLGDPSASVRATAARALGRKGNNGATAALRERRGSR